MPYCSRCTAIWIGLALGLGFMVFYRIELDMRFLLVMLIGLLPILVDGGGQLFGFWESTNLIRVVTGASAGILSGITVGVIIDEVKTSRCKSGITGAEKVE